MRQIGRFSKVEIYIKSIGGSQKQIKIGWDEKRKKNKYGKIGQYIDTCTNSIELPDPVESALYTVSEILLYRNGEAGRAKRPDCIVYVDKVTPKDWFLRIVCEDFEKFNRTFKNPDNLLSQVDVVSSKNYLERVEPKRFGYIPLGNRNKVEYVDSMAQLVDIACDHHPNAFHFELKDTDFILVIHTGTTLEGYIKDLDLIGGGTYTDADRRKRFEAGLERYEKLDRYREKRKAEERKTRKPVPKAKEYYLARAEEREAARKRAAADILSGSET